jgi:hypothetical protein
MQHPTPFHDESTSYLHTATTTSVRDGVCRAIAVCGGALVARDPDLAARWVQVLQNEYRHVDEISALVRGRFVRWIHLSPYGEPGKLVTGGIVLDTEPGQSGSMIVTCKNSSGKLFRFDFNAAITFQKLTPMEKVIVALNDKTNHLAHKTDVSLSLPSV